MQYVEHTVGPLLEEQQARHAEAQGRSTAIMALGYGVGLRRAESAGPALDDGQSDSGEVTTMRVVGQRGKERRAYLDGGAAQHRRAWLRGRGTEPGPCSMPGAPIFARVAGHGAKRGARRSRRTRPAQGGGATLQGVWGDTLHLGTTPMTYRYTEQRDEATIGLYYYGARWYDPALGRFIQPDTMVPNPEAP